jgi:hypothetical protein
VGLQVFHVLSKPNVMIGLFSLIKAFLVQSLVFFAEFCGALLEADVLLVRALNCLPHVLTVRAQETPCSSVFVSQGRLGGATPGTVGIDDPSSARRCHMPEGYGLRPPGRCIRVNSKRATNLETGHPGADCSRQHSGPASCCQVSS